MRGFRPALTGPVTHASQTSKPRSTVLLYTSMHDLVWYPNPDARYYKGPERPPSFTMLARVYSSLFACTLFSFLSGLHYPYESVIHTTPMCGGAIANFKVAQSSQLQREVFTSCPLRATGMNPGTYSRNLCQRSRSWGWIEDSISSHQTS